MESMETFRKDQIRVAEYSGGKALMKKLTARVDIVLSVPNAEGSGRDQKFRNVCLTGNERHRTWKIKVENVAPDQVN